LCKIWSKSMQEFRKYETFNILPVWLENAYSHPQNWCFRWISPPKWAAMSTKPQKGTSAGRNGSSGVCDKEEEEEEEERHISGLFGIAVKWP